VSPLEQALNDYISIRHNLGFRFRLPASSLRTFVAFLDAENASHITTKLALQWAIQPSKAQPSTWAWRLGWFDVSPSGSAPLILAPRFLLSAFSRIVTGENHLTFIATRKSTKSFVEPNNFHLRNISVPRRIRLFSAFWRSLGYGSMKLSDWIGRCQPRPRNSSYPPHEVWEIALRSGSSFHGRCSEELRRIQRSSVPCIPDAGVLYLRAW